KFGDSWDAPLDVLQLLMDDPEIAPDFDPNHVNYNMIVDIIGVFAFASMSTTSTSAAYALVELAKRKKDYWKELYQEAQEINKHLSRRCLSETYTFANGFQVPRGRQVLLDVREVNFDEEFQGGMYLKLDTGPIVERWVLALLLANIY
ncbi:26994_t:CDS:2, partial [Racocetra persica]